MPLFNNMPQMVRPYGTLLVIKTDYENKSINTLELIKYRKNKINVFIGQDENYYFDELKFDEDRKYSRMCSCY